MEWIPREKEDQLKTITTKSETVQVFFHLKNVKRQQKIKTNREKEKVEAITDNQITSGLNKSISLKITFFLKKPF